MKRRSCWCSTLLLVLAVLAPHGLAQATSDRAFSEMFVFGDSLSDTGNAFILTGGFVCAPPYSGGRPSNGPMWVEVLANRLGLLPPAPSLAGGTNYAYWGASCGYGLSSFAGILVPSLGLQVDTFLADEPEGFMGDELIVVWCGTNNMVDPNQPVQTIVDNIVEQITRLAEAGGRTFLVPSFYAIGQCPYLVHFNPSASAGVNARAKETNRRLGQQLRKLERLYDIDILSFATDQLVHGMLQHPHTFGLINVTDPAYPGGGFGFPPQSSPYNVVFNPHEYLWWDLVHPSRAAHRIIGNWAADSID